MASATAPRIVCGLDESEHASAVLACAAALAHRLELPLQVVHSPASDVFTAGDERRDDLQAGHAAMARVPGLQMADWVTIQPGPPAEVLRASLAGGAVLGVVGSRGRGPLRAALLGSVSTELVQEAPCPVVVVPPGAEPLPADGPASIVCRLDGSVDDRPTLDAAVWIADALGGSLSAVNVTGRLALPVGTSPMWIQRDLEELGVSPAVRVESGNAADQMRDVAERHAGSMIVVGWDGDLLTPGAVAGKLAARSQRPVMVIPPRARVPAQAKRNAHAA